MVDFFRILASNRHIFFCPMNFVADTYIGCPHSCLYCYAPSYSARFKRYESSSQIFRKFRPRFKSSLDFEKIEDAIENGNVKGACPKNQEELVEKASAHRQPLRIGSVSDPLAFHWRMNAKTLSRFSRFWSHMIIHSSPARRTHWWRHQDTSTC